MIQINEWVWSDEHRQIGRVVDVQTIWGQQIYQVWQPGLNTVIRVNAASLRLLADAQPVSSAGLSYVAAAARLLDLPAQDVLLAPIEAAILPLPHQLRAVSRALSGDRVRYLLADEVGLGKTIEAGLILRELKLRGQVQRTLIVSPKGLVTQWVSEMQLHFGENFRLIVPADYTALHQVDPTYNLWRLSSQVICTMDSIKPIEGRRSWTKEQTADYNRQRFEDLLTAGWDLIIVDEAHRLGGSSEQVARYQLGQGLAESAPYLLLLSATPHQGKSDAFHRLVALLDRDAFPHVDSVTQDRVQPYVIRTEKRRAIDATGQPLFQPRCTQLVPVTWSREHQVQRRLYDAVTEYVRLGYNQAISEKKPYLGFLMLLMQRLVTSSTRAIRTTLERRLEVLQLPDEQLSFLPTIVAEEWLELDGQEQVETLTQTRLQALNNERGEVELLLELAARTEAAGPDAKAAALLDWLYRLQREAGDPDLKLLVFTEFVSTQEMLCQFLGERGFPVVVLNGSMDMAERQAMQTEFAGTARIMVSTDAGGEGLNLQFCHVVVNYDMPWNPMRIEQRIGRVDRIGQQHPVRALNFVLEDTVEHRVQEVLTDKLQIILEEFGVDKTGDVLDSALAEELFEDVYREAILQPERLSHQVETLLAEIQARAGTTRAVTQMLAQDEALDPAQAKRLIDHPLPRWVEQMTVSYLQAYGGSADKRGSLWDLRWPTGEIIQGAVFTAREAESSPLARHLTLEDPLIRALVERIPLCIEDQAIPRVELSNLPAEVRGYWSLWRVALHTSDRTRQRVLPLFLDDAGHALVPTARRIWEQLLNESVPIVEEVRGVLAVQAHSRVQRAAEHHGKPLHDELVRAQQRFIARERSKGEYAFAARRRAIERLGLPAVRQHRLNQLQADEQTWRAALVSRSDAAPELTLLLILRIGQIGG